MASDPKNLDNAVEIIERFGGIRPMASKMDVPVTTVQGWKKRNAIPEDRVEDVMKAAEEHDIDLSDVANENNKMQEKQPSEPPKLEKISGEAHDILMAEIRNSTQNAIRTSIWATVILLLLTVGAAVFMFMPQAQQVEENSAELQAVRGDVNALEEEVRDVNQRTSFIRKLIPEELEATVDDLQNQARNVQNNVQQLAVKADTIQKTLLSDEPTSLATRLRKLEEEFDGFKNAPQLAMLVDRVDALEKTMNGQMQLGDAMKELTTMMQDVDGRVGELAGDITQTDEKVDALEDKMMEDKLAAAQEKETALGKTLEGVSREDMKAAVTLLAFSQLRDSLGREVPFEEDLVLLDRVAGDDPEFKAAIERLAPHADGGVLTSEGLSQEFKGLAGEIAFASLKGEEISFWDRLKARFNKALKVEKDGELVNGNDTQILVARAQKQLDAGDVNGAVATLQQLDGKAADKAQPFIEQAQATAMTNDIQGMLQNMIISNIGQSFGGDIDAGSVFDTLKEKATGGPDAESSGVVRDDESGFAILPRQQGGFKGLKPLSEPNQP